MSRQILVTGAAGGIGSSVVSHLAARGHSVIATDRSELPGDLPEEASFVQADLPLELVTLADHIPATIGGIVHVAGIIRTHRATEIDVETFDQIFRANVLVPLLLVSRLSDRLVEGGSIVFVGSVAGTRASPSNLLYAASKAALHNAAKSLAADLASRRIRVNVVVPGLIDTSLTSTMNEDLAGLRKLSVAEVARQRAAAVPIGRIGLPQDVAAGVAYLMSAEASFITGSELLITGGGHL